MTTFLAEKPFAGAVFCFTSVSADLRTEYAQYAEEMGGEHKLDLTSEVTHLLVGDTNTPKYKYVAREREDVKVLQPHYILAVRAKWMDAQVVDIPALEKEYGLPPLHGLKICITGFEDLNFRQQLHENIIQHGGQYSGDLTKDVTHLIALQAQGKKYEFATQWQIQVVGLKWYKDTLERGMQLDESLYHPAKPVDEQGIGAWTRRSDKSQSLGKRQRQSSSALPRKLRRTASSRLGSQTDNMLSNIVKPTSDTDANANANAHTTGAATGKQALRQSKSMPALKADLRPPPPPPGGNRSPALSSKPDYLAGKSFLIARFDQQKSLTLKQIITSTGGVVLNSTDELRSMNDSDPSTSNPCLLIVPWHPSSEDLPHIPGTEIVTELWLEYCMEQKTFVPSADYIYASLLSSKKMLAFSQLKIASNGFAGIQVRHLAKITAALGAQYSEVFDHTISVLICKSSSDNANRKMKMRNAQAWAIPVVSERWLEACIQEQRRVSLDPYLLQPCRNAAVQKPKAQHVPAQGENSKEREHRPLKEISSNSPRKQPSSDKSGKAKKRLFQAPPATEAVAQSSHATDSPAPGGSPSAPAPACIGDARTLNGEIQDLLNIKAKAKASVESVAAAADASKKPIGRALSNLSNGSVSAHRKLSRASSIGSMNTDGIGSEICFKTGQHQSQESVAGEAQPAFTGRAMSRLLDGTTPSSTSASASASASASVPAPAPVGLDAAISVTVSIEDLSYQGEGESQAEAQAKGGDGAASAAGAGAGAGAGDSDLQQVGGTQLVYDDPDDAILLREKLAAKRRARSRLGQKDCDPRPEVLRERQQQQEQTEEGLKDSAIMTVAAGAGAGAGTRTRARKTGTRLDGF